MTTYYVLSEPCSNDPDGDLIVTSIFNPKPGHVIAEFAVPKIDFNPMTYMNNDQIKKRQQLDAETLEKAQAFLQAHSG